MYKDFKKSETLDTGFTSGNSLLWMFSGIVLGLIVGLGMYFFTNDKIPSISMIDSLEQKIQTAQTKKPNPQTNVASSDNQQSQQKTGSVVEQKAVEKERKNKFSYYAVLPTLDVPVGSSKPINTSAVAASNAVKEMDKSTEKSLSQQYEEAVAKQNSQEIQSQEVETSENIETIKESSTSLGDYLLQVASFKKQSMANKTKGRLSNKGIDAYIQKKKIKGRYWYRVVAGPVDQNNINSWKSTAEQLGHKPLVISVR